MKPPILVYLAGPYTKPDPCANTNTTIKVADELAALGFVPFVPHLTLLWHVVSPHPYEFWTEYDLHWLRQCDALLRIPGESSGADKEIAEARRICIPVFDSIDDLAAWGYTDKWAYVGKAFRDSLAAKGGVQT